MASGGAADGATLAGNDVCASQSVAASEAAASEARKGSWVVGEVPSETPLELRVLKPEPTTVVGVTCETRRGGVTVVAMGVDGAGFAAGLRVGDVLLSVNGEQCTEPTQTATVLKAAQGKLVIELIRSEVAIKPKSNPLKFWSRR